MNPRCPDYFQERVTRAGGVNRYGQPNFILVWSQSYTQRAGGVWPHDKYAGYREIYVANGSPHPPKQGYWTLMEWTPPEQYNGEAAYYFLHRDETTGLCSLGPYPHRGRYIVASKLVWTTIMNGMMVIDPWKLTSKVVNFIIPVILQAKQVSLKKRREFVAAEKIRLERKQASLIDSVMNDAKRPLLKQEAIDDRIRLMEKQWAEFLKNPPALKRGVQMVH